MYTTIKKDYLMSLKVSNAHKGCIYMIKISAKTVLRNNLIKSGCFLSWIYLTIQFIPVISVSLLQYSVSVKLFYDDDSKMTFFIINIENRTFLLS